MKKEQEEVTESGAKAQLRSRGYLPVTEAAERLGYTTQCLYNWADAKLIHEVRLSKGRWVEWASVIAYFKKASPEAAKLAGLV